MVNGNIISRPMMGFPMFNHYGIVIDAENGIIADYGSRGKRVGSITNFMAHLKKFKLHDSNMMGEDSDAILNRFEKVNTDGFEIWWDNCADFMKHFGRGDLYHTEAKKLAAILIVLMLFFLAIKDLFF